MKLVLGKYDTVIWDWNGTLLNDIWLILETVNYMLSKSNKPHIGLSEFRSKYEYPLPKFLANLGFEGDPLLMQQLYIKFVERYEMNVWDSSLMPHALDSVKSMYTNGIKQILVSMRRKKQVLRETKSFGVFPFMHQVIGNKADLEYDKYEMLNRYLKYNDVDYEKTICIGDTLYDFEVAHEFGLDCILLSGGYQDLNKVADNEIHIIQSLKELQLF